MSMVPTLHNEECVPLSDGNTVTVDKTSFHKVLLGGDQLTATRVRGTKSLKQIETRAVDRLHGLIPVVEDWHARMAFVTVSNFFFICWASEASPTLGCSIEISRDIYIYMSVCMSVVVQKSVGGITWAKRAHAQSQYWAVKSYQ